MFNSPIFFSFKNYFVHLFKLSLIFMRSCLYKYYYHVSSWGCKIYFFKKNLIIQKIYSCKDSLLLAIATFHQVFLLSKTFLLECPYFLSIMLMKIFLVYNLNTEQSLISYIFFLLIHQWKIFVNFFKITHVYVFNNLNY